MNNEYCYCGKPATMYVDSDSIQYQDHGMPVCDEHGEDGDPFEAPIPNITERFRNAR